VLLFSPPSHFSPSPPIPAELPLQPASEPRASCGGSEMAELNWILEREQRQIDQIMELDMEELQFEAGGR